MKIVCISHSADIGGAEICLAETIRSLVQRGASIIAFVPRMGPLVERLSVAGAEVRTAHYTWWMAPARRQLFLPRLKRRVINIRAKFELMRHIRELKPDVVISNSLTCAVGAFAAHHCRLPHVWSIHELYGNYGHGLFFDGGNERALGQASRVAARIVVPSQAAWDIYLRIFGLERLRLVPYAIHLPYVPKHCPSARTAFTLVQLGAIIPGKRAEDAIRAVGLLRRDNMPVRLQLIGSEDPEYGRFLRNLIKHEAIEQAVELKGFVNNPLDCLAEADACVMCSWGECAPRVTIEAMKVGLPVIAARSGGLTEQIRDGKTGLLFRPGDATDLADKIRLLLKSPSLRQTIAQAGQQWANATFNLTRHGAEWERVLVEAIETSHAS